jgi:hypothetical protein
MFVILSREDSEGLATSRRVPQTRVVRDTGGGMRHRAYSETEYLG